MTRQFHEFFNLIFGGFLTFDITVRTCPFENCPAASEPELPRHYIGYVALEKAFDLLLIFLFV